VAGFSLIVLSLLGWIILLELWGGTSRDGALSADGWLLVRTIGCPFTSCSVH
jgi:hypothetical protein